MNYWAWVFGSIDALSWVADHRLMAFPAHAAARMRDMSDGDRAVLYVTRGAHHNPGRDEARLAGLATVTSHPRVEQPPLQIAGRPFHHSIKVEFDCLLPDRTGPVIRDLVAELELVRKPQYWGSYFRRSPVALNEHDFMVLERAVREASR